MSQWSDLTDAQLETDVIDYERRLERSESLSHELRRQLTNLQAEYKARRANRFVSLPFWALEVLSAHARKRYENLTSSHRTSTYANALDHARNLVGDIMPCHIDGEYHDPSKKGRR